jgi:hypothetical protein
MCKHCRRSCIQLYLPKPRLLLQQHSLLPTLGALNRLHLLEGPVSQYEIPRAFRVYLHILCGPSNQSECRELENVVFSQFDWPVFVITSYFVEGAVASTTNEVKLSAFVEAGNLKTAWYMASTLWVHRVSAAVIQKSNKFVTRRTFQVRAVSIAVPIACPCDESLQILSTFMA